MKRRTVLQLAGVSAFALGADSAWALPSPAGYARVMNGPMVVPPTPDSIRVWVRTSGEYAVMLQVSETADFASPLSGEPVVASEENDFCTVVSVTGLRPDTEYYYRVSVDGELDRYLRNRLPNRTRTALPAASVRNFSIGFGSCARFQLDALQPIWDHVAKQDPDLFLWLGDNIYGDSLEAETLKQEWRRQRDVIKLQPVINRIPQLAIWDDHDFGLNDHDRTNPVKEQALEIFRHYWGNPSYGLPEAPGVFFTYQYGPVDFFFLDVRYNRDPNALADGPDKTMLGAEQLEWLKAGLRESKAAFKLLVSGSGWTVAKGPGGDSWSAFVNERDDLFDFIQNEEIGGVVLLSGDTHMGELNCIPRSDRGGYDLYDLVSSPLAQPPSDNWMDRRPELRIRRPETTASNFGALEFDFSSRPKLTFRLVNAFGREPWEPFTIYADQLVNGQSSWRDAIDPDEYRRQEGDLEPVR